MNKYFGMFAFICFCAIMFSIPSYAVNIDNKLGGSLYGDQAAVSDAIKKTPKIMNQLKQYNISIDTTTIMPEYSADLLDYAKTGTFKYTPDIINNEQVYYAKTVTHEGKFAGNIRFTAGSSDLDMIQYTPSSIIEPENKTVFSISYEDNAKRILALAKKSSLRPSEVRLIRINLLGLVYYINDGTSEAFVAADGGNANIFDYEKGTIVYIDDNFKNLADEELRKDNEWKAYIATLPPGNIPTGGNNYSICAINTNMINDIVHKSALISAKDAISQQSHSLLYIILAVIILIIALGVIRLMFMFKKSKLKFKAPAVMENNH